jgi:hypothetical protein
LAWKTRGLGETGAFFVDFSPKLGVHGIAVYIRIGYLAGDLRR